jgi:hypothetical protein
MRCSVCTVAPLMLYFQIHESWLGEYWWDNPNKENGTASPATGIELNGNDHYVTNTIVFSSHIGVQVR